MEEATALALNQLLELVQVTGNAQASPVAAKYVLLFTTLECRRHGCRMEECNNVHSLQHEECRFPAVTWAT